MNTPQNNTQDDSLLVLSAWGTGMVSALILSATLEEMLAQEKFSQQDIFYTVPPSWLSQVSREPSC